MMNASVRPGVLISLAMLCCRLSIVQSDIRVIEIG